MKHDDDYLREALAETLAIHRDRALNPTDSVVPPIFQTATFRSTAAEFVERAGEPRGSGFYTRHGNPTFSQAESVIAALEGAEAAMMTGSGMGALTTCVLTLVGAGEHIVTQTSLYAGTGSLLRGLLARLNISHTPVDQADPKAFADAIRPETRLILLETPSNPLMRITDLRAVAEVARARGIPTLVDNTFATPINQRPIEHGVDLVFHSGTKYFGGHSDLMAGAIAGTSEMLDRIWRTHLLLGSVPGPFECWLLLRGLRTLALRVRQHNLNAFEVARVLERHPAVEAVHYPGLESHPQHEVAARQMSGFGGMMTVDIKGGYAAAEKFISRLRIITCATSLGGVESLAAHLAAMWVKYLTEEQLRAAGISLGAVRLSIGIENIADLLSDLEQALA